MTKEQFNAVDLRKQLTEELKGKWYYKDRKWGLRINKHSVVFDDCFKFEIKYHSNPFYGNPEFPNESQGDVVVYEDDCPKYELGEYDGIFDDDDKYCNKTTGILEAILVYIANYI